MDEIANSHLKEKDIPPPNGEYWGVIDRFALSFNGYNYWDSFDKCAWIGNSSKKTWKKNKVLPVSLTELRTCLFFEQRRWRHFDDHPDSETMVYIHALVEAIRKSVRSEELD